jgi:putative N6-adenine-specific DNA methylase
MTKNASRFLASTFFGLEQVLAEELLQLGAENIQTHNRAVSFTGDKKLLYQANLKLRTALRILTPIASFNVNDQHALYKGAKDITWENYLEPNGTIYIHAISNHPAFNNTMFVAQKVKDAIADRFREKSGQRPSIDKHIPDLQIQVHISNDKCTISLDSSGVPLYKRGYRKDTGEAPINEILAAGMVMLSKWDTSKTLIDPMCGSGTVLIEAAMYALNIAPGLYRNFYAFQNWKDYDHELWQQVTDEAKKQIVQKKINVIGCDKSQNMLFKAIANMETCNLDDVIQLNKSDFYEYEPPTDGGWVITNPPYGERLGDPDKIVSLYKEMGDVLKKKYSGYEAWIVSSNIDALKKVGLYASRKITLFNGPLECKLMRYQLYQGSKKDGS